MTALIIMAIFSAIVTALYYTIYVICIAIRSLYHMIKDKHSLKTKGYRQDYWSKQ